MSTVFIHVGQAGNEVAGAFWQLAGAERPPKRWLFDERGHCRAVLIDTEPKVVRGVAASLGPEKLHARCALVEQGGRGNNWAMGYHGADVGSGGIGMAEAALEALRWQCERCDWCTGVMLCHSIGGGTGAGLGSRLLQEVRDAYPTQLITAASLSPFAAGELPLGFYNSVLALSFLQERLGLGGRAWACEGLRGLTLGEIRWDGVGWDRMQCNAMQCDRISLSLLS